MLSGELVQWNDERGFGFIAGSDGQRYFVHISSITRINTRPRAGDDVRFQGGKGPDGRLVARSVSIRGANPLPSRHELQRGDQRARTRWSWRVIVSLILGALLFIGVGLRITPWQLVLPYSVMSVVAFTLYGLDKDYAKAGRWRVPEATLLTIDLLFGIVGGLMGQHYFRHKTVKPGYVATTILLAVVHGSWLAGLATGMIRLDEITALLA